MGVPGSFDGKEGGGNTICYNTGDDIAFNDGHDMPCCTELPL